MHIPVLLKETINGLNLKQGGTYVDCTVNRAGHSVEIAKSIGQNGKLICIDLDKEALDEAKNILNKIDNHPELFFINSNFRDIKNILSSLSINKIDGLVVDLGISSQEFDESKRGFSFRFNEPLLMTFSSEINKDTLTAHDVVNSWGEETLADILFHFADERYARKIAKKIVEERKIKEIKTTNDLVTIIESSVPAFYRNRKINCATKTFLAIRMAVNDELGSLKDLISSLPEILSDGGRASVITFHSTEDRIVKQEIKSIKELKAVNKKVISPSREEQKENPRARSAKLRIVEKL